MSSGLYSIATATRILFASVLLCIMGACAPMMTMPLSELPPAFHQVRADGKTVRLAVHEAGRGKPILLLHGLGASSYTWRTIMPQLARTHRVIALDLKGFGQSDKPLDDAYSISDQARLVEDYIVRNNLRGVTLVGHSFGGTVAMAVALDDAQNGPHRIERLVLIDSLAYKQPVPFFFRLLRTPILGELGLSLVPPDVQAARALAIAYYHGERVRDETVASYAEPLRSEGGKHALLSTVESLTKEDADAFSARYPKLKTPTLLIWCEHDRIVPLRFGKRLSQDLPNAKVEVIEECGHIPQEEEPGETLTAMKSFLAQ
jgi:pimeloyl-ACP methyl ester carboxylesterase